MIEHQKIINEIKDELFADENVAALILYGSAARNEVCENSDIDLMVIKNERILLKRQVLRDSVLVEFLELNADVLNEFLDKYEVPMIYALSEGIVLFDKTAVTDGLIKKAKEIYANGPPAIKNPKKKRSDLTEIYRDLLDVEDENEAEFNYIASLLVSDAISIILQTNGLWEQSRKKTLAQLKEKCYEGYKYIEILLNPAISREEKRSAAKDLAEYALKPLGGIINGDVLIFRVE